MHDEEKNKDILKYFKPISFDEAVQILIHEDSYSRLEKMAELSFGMAESEWLKIFGQFWSICDNIGVFDSQGGFESMHYLWDRVQPCMEMMTEDEQKAFDELPDEIIVYRGCTQRNKWGPSWSLDRAIAESFPFLNRYHHGKDRPLLIKGRVKKTQISALKLDRDEAEVVCLGVMPKHISTSTARDVRGKGGEKAAV